MNRTRWTLWTAAIFLAAGLVGLDAYWHWHDSAAKPRDVLLSILPPDARAGFFVDFAELRRAPFAAQLYNWIPKSQADAEYAQFLRDTSFDYERDLDRAAIALIKGEKESKLFAVAEGRFDRKKIEAYASRSGTRENRSGREIFSVPLGDSARKISFAFLSSEKLAVTDSGDLVPFLAPTPNSADARAWRARFTRVAGAPRRAGSRAG